MPDNESSGSPAAGTSGSSASPTNSAPTDTPAAPANGADIEALRLVSVPLGNQAKKTTVSELASFASLLAARCCTRVRGVASC